PFPGVIGCIDGTHIQIPAPKNNRGSYYNRKGFHSILLQVVCDADKKFTDVFCGWPGSTNDARMWKRSALYQKLQNDAHIRANDYHLLGDSAYKIEKLSSIRVIVEQAIGLLKGRFRWLKYLDMSKIQTMSKVVNAACILHNFCIDMSDELPELYTEDDEDLVTEASDVASVSNET
ncbi:putative nuclease HARBI1, partial [Blattella germanica]